VTVRTPESLPKRNEQDPGRFFGEVTEGLAALVVAVSVFVPWFGVSIGPIGVSVTGAKDHPYLYVAVVLSLIELAVLAAGLREGGGSGRLPVRRELLVAGISVLTLAIVVFAFASKGSALAGWRFGAWMALGAAGTGALVSAAVARATGVRA
jgi:hypothetical protein